MNARVEFFFLAELRYLIAEALHHARRLEDMSVRWAEAAQTAHALARKAYTTRESLRSRSTDREKWNEAMRTTQSLQGEFFSELESFLAVASRISLTFFPARSGPGGVHTDRGTHLRALAGIDEKHPIADRDIRNKWQHFDEALDLVAGDGVSAQRFVLASEVSEAEANSTLRLLVVDTMTVSYLGVGTLALRPLFGALRELEGRVAELIVTWPERNAAELGIDTADG